MDGILSEIIKIVAIYLTINLLFSYLIHKIRSDLDKDENLKLVEQVKELIHVVKVETHQGVDYWYDKDNGTFIAQGNTIGDAIEHARTRYPKHVFILLDNEENIAGIICEATGWKPEPHNGQEFKFKL